MSVIDGQPGGRSSSGGLRWSRVGRPTPVALIGNVLERRHGEDRGGCKDDVVTSSGPGFDFDRQRHVRGYAARLQEEAERLTWPLEALHRLRDERLRSLLRTAKERSSWHARRLTHVDPDAVTGDDLSMIPVMTKADVMANWDDVVTDRRLTLERAEAHLLQVASEGPAYLLGDHQVLTTGGSSGTRGVFVWDFEGFLMYALGRDRGTLWLQQHAGRTESRRAIVAASHATHATSVLARTFAGSPQLGATRSFPVTLPLEQIVDGLNAFEPTDLMSYTSMLRRLGEERRRGKLRISPASLMCAGEPLTPDARADIEEAFGCPLSNLYAATEVGIIARSYPGSIGLHLNEDIAVYEPVDAGNNPVSPGTRARKLLVTNVVNHALPLIRYELADEVTVLDEPNPDPWTGRRIADIQGRSDDVFVYGRVEVHPYVFRSVIGRRREVLEYQVRQTTTGADITVRTASPIDTSALTRELHDDLAALGLARPAVRVSVVDSIPRPSEAGKLRTFVPLTSPS
ncbi:MAG TPA: AMP-binding protein [Acidimicrobiales bacterium]|nr:AMP-binding protein [Acidimicrobiales bacterium]